MNNSTRNQRLSTVIRAMRCPMENLNAEIFSLRNQRKLISKITTKLDSVLKNFDDLENDLLKSQYKHGIMIAFDEIVDNEEIYQNRLEQLFKIKQKYHHLWAESQLLLQAINEHYSSEKGLLTEIQKKIESLTNDNIEEIKSLKEEKKRKKEHIFRDLSNVKKEIDDMENIISDLQNMAKYVEGSSDKAYYTKEVKEYNRITDKIKSEEQKLEQFQSINNTNMITTTNALLRSLYAEKDTIVKKTMEAITETIQSLEEKMEYRKKVADKYLKIKSIRLLIQGLPMAGKYTMVHSLDKYSALQRKGNYSMVQAPDYFFNGFKGLLVWVEDEAKQEGKILTLDEFEENFEFYKERVKIKIEMTCATGFIDEKVFNTLVEGMHFSGILFLYDVSDPETYEMAKILLQKTQSALNFEKKIPTLVFANKNDLLTKTHPNQLEDSILISVLNDKDELQSNFTKFVNNIIRNNENFKRIFNIEIQ